jgi:hypothetical protein
MISRAASLNDPQSALRAATKAAATRHATEIVRLAAERDAYAV